MSYHTKLQETEFFNSMRQPFDNDEEMINLYLSVMTNCASVPRDLDTFSFWSDQDLEPFPFDYSSASRSAMARDTTGRATLPYVYSAIPSIRQPNNVALPAKRHSMETSKTPPVMLFTTAPQDHVTRSLWSLQGVKPSPTGYSLSSKSSSSVAATMPNVTPNYDSAIPSMGSGVLFTSLTASQEPVPYQTLRYQNLSFEVGPTEVIAFSSEGMDCFANKQADFQPLDNGWTTKGVARSHQQQQQNPSAHRRGFHAPPPTTPENTKTASCVLKNRARKKAKLLKASSGAPFRPLSPYNYFFRDERERLLLQQDHLDSDVAVRNLSPAKEQQLLLKQWNRDKTAKRAHRKSHGKISFQTLTVSIAAAWRRLGAHEKAFYKTVSDKDWTRYRSELHVYKTVTLAEQKIGADGTEQGV